MNTYFVDVYESLLTVQRCVCCVKVYVSVYLLCGDVTECVCVGWGV